MKSREKYIANMLTPRFQSWWLRSNQLSEHHFEYDAEKLRKSYQSFDKLFRFLWSFLFISVWGWSFVILSNDESLFCKVSMVVGPVGSLWVLVLMVKRHLLFRNYLLRELATEWAAAFKDLKSIKTFRGMTEDGSLETISEKINEQLVAWAFECLKMKASQTQNCAKYRRYTYMIKRVLKLSKKLQLKVLEQNDVWARAKAERI